MEVEFADHRIFDTSGTEILRILHPSNYLSHVVTLCGSGAIISMSDSNKVTEPSQIITILWLI